MYALIVSNAEETRRRSFGAMCAARNSAVRVVEPPNSVVVEAGRGNGRTSGRRERGRAVKRASRLLPGRSINIMLAPF